MATIDHVTLRVTDFEASRRFYDTVLRELGIASGYVDPSHAFAEWGDFSIAADGGPLTRRAHVAFVAPDNRAVDAFWDAGTKAGYTGNGPPGERAAYHPGYYAAYLFDPDGHNVEAVCHNR